MILLKLLNFKIDFFGAETTSRMYFTVLENNVKLKIRITHWLYPKFMFFHGKNWY